MGGDGAAVVLEEEIDKDYEPTQQELQEYAEWLGIDLEKDYDLLWIAKAGLKAPLPHPWKPCQTGKEGELFYFNFETGESVWDHPCDEYHRSLYHKERAKKYGLPCNEPDVPDPNAPAQAQNSTASPSDLPHQEQTLPADRSGLGDSADASGNLGESTTS